MSFVSADQVMNTMEELVVYLWQTMGEGSLVGGTSGKFPRLTYASALATYGSDKPDLRYPWKLRGRSDHLGARAEGEILEETLTVGSFGSSGEDSHFTFPIDALTREHWRLLAKLIEPFAHQVSLLPPALHSAFNCKAFEVIVLTLCKMLLGSPPPIDSSWRQHIAG